VIAPRFDQVAKAMARPGLSRRNALLRVTSAGFVASVLTAVGQGSRNVAVAQELPGPKNCCEYWNNGVLVHRICTGNNLCPCTGSAACPWGVYYIYSELKVDTCSACPAFPGQECCCDGQAAGGSS
jgi:hypothetical protein